MAAVPWKAAGKPAQLIVAKGYNHYEVGETIGHPYAVIGRAAMQMIAEEILRPAGAI